MSRIGCVQLRSHVDSNQLQETFTFIREHVNSTLTKYWSDKHLQKLFDNVSPQGKRLASQGHEAFHQLGWSSTCPDGTPNRVKRLVAEHVVRLLRAQGTLQDIVDKVVSVWPSENGVLKTTNVRRGRAQFDTEDWKLFSAATQGSNRLSVRRVISAVNEHIKTYNKLPYGLTTLWSQPPVVTKNLLLVAATDKQYHKVMLSADNSVYTIDIKTLQEGTWVWGTALTFCVPKHVRSFELKKPCIRSVDDKVVLDLPYTRPTPTKLPTSNTVVAVDWGRRKTTLTVKTPTDYREHYLKTAASGKLVRLQTLSEQLATKICRKQALGLDADVLVQHKTFVNSRRHNLAKAIADQQATWVLAHTLGHGATTLVVENLTSLQNPGARTKFIELLQAKAADHGITVKAVNPAYTSSVCCHCAKPVSKVLRPGTDVKGHGWVRCECGLSLDRDANAARNIANKAKVPGATPTKESTQVEVSYVQPVPAREPKSVNVTKTKLSRSSKCAKLLSLPRQHTMPDGRVRQSIPADNVIGPATVTSTLVTQGTGRLWNTGMLVTGTVPVTAMSGFS